MNEADRQGEEWVNALTHGLGVVASALGGAALVYLAVRLGDFWQIVGAAVYAASLVLLYSASTLYHAVRSGSAKARLRVLDHCAIYLLIAGTYTPFALGALRGQRGWSLLLVLWSLALGGIVYKLFLLERFPRLSTGMYLAMGWLAVPMLPSMARLLPLSTVLWLVAGGVAYTAGTYFFHATRIRYAHAIWHGFVLTGSACHFVAVLSQVLPAGGA
jgi:hemolysin III